VAASPPFASPEERLARIPDLVVRGALDEAARLCTEVLAAAPGHARAEYFAGLVAFERGADVEAEDAYRRAILHAREPSLRAAAWHGLARLEERRGDLPRASEDLRKAFANEPENPIHLRSLGEILLARRRDEEAEEVLRAALRIDGSDAATWGLLAEALFDRGRYPEALAALDTCESRLGPRAPRFAETVGLRARIALVRGELTTAEEAYRTALERDPDYPGHASLVEIHRIRTPDDPLLAWLEARREKLAEHAPLAVRIDLAYALGKAYEDLGRAEEAFAAYAEGARLARSPRAGESLALVTRRIEILRRAFTKERTAALLRARGELEPEDVGFRPVFLVGLPRGGSTLLEQSLAAHPAVAAGGELPHAHRLAETLLAAWYAQGSIPPEDATAATRTLVDLAVRYARVTADLRRGRPVFVDKSLSNYQYVGLLAVAFPRALFLDVHKRDALDQCWGIFRRSFGHGHEYSRDLEDIGRVWRLYRGLMDHWRDVLPEGRLREIVYEDLVDDPERTIRTVLDALDLPFDPACLHPERVARPVTTSSLVQVREPIHRERVNAARPFLPWLEPLRRILESPESEDRTNPV
jgi:tetratricopeptide (TPR) repeat protein